MLIVKYCLLRAGAISLQYTKDVEILVKIFSLQMPFLKCRHLDFRYFFGFIWGNYFIADRSLGVIFLDFT